MSGVGTELLLIAALLLLNGLLAMSEIAVVSARKARLRQLAAAGNRGARSALALTENPTRCLSTVQIGITLVGILAGAFGGATIAEQINIGIGPEPSCRALQRSHWSGGCGAHAHRPLAYRG